MGTFYRGNHQACCARILRPTLSRTRPQIDDVCSDLEKGVKDFVLIPKIMIWGRV
jgi:hypothetical protein